MTHPSERETAVYEMSPHELVICEIIHRGAHACKIAFDYGGVHHEIYVSNEDIIFTEDWELE